MKNKLYLLLAFLLSIVQTGMAQSLTVSGIVTDAKDGSPLPGVSVIIKGTQLGTATNALGKFTITVNKDAVLIFTFIGMQTQEMQVEGQKNLKIRMKAASIGIEEVVVTGYGTTTKGSFTGSAAVLGRENIINKTEANPIKALEGSVSGLQLNTSSGQPGAPSTIFIRGRNSYNSGTQPLYVIDGVPIESRTMGVRNSESASISPLATLNSADIESITVLKDATATSIYGARAANGVIVITTKQGARGKTKVNISVKYGIDMLPAFTDRYKLLNQTEYEEIMIEGLVNSGKATDKKDGLQFLYNQFGLEPGKGTNTDWFDEVTRTGKIQDYNIDISGGGANEKAARYYLSFNYFNNESIVISKDLERFSGRLNLEQEPNKTVKFGLNSSFSYTVMNLGAGGGYFSDPITLAYSKMNPLIAVRNELGEWNINTSKAIGGYNPVAQRSETGDKNEGKQYRAILSPYITIRFAPAWSFTSRGGMDLYSLKEHNYWSFLQPQGLSMRGMGEQGTTTRTLLSITNTLSYVQNFDDHHVNLMLGQEAQHTRDNSSYLSGSNFPVDYLNQVSLTAVPSDASTTLDNVALASFFFNGQYDYANKYYLSASVRTDGSSRFGSNNRWGTFYSIGARYRLAAESFMAGTANWLDELTLRTSYGTSGNQEVGDSWYASRGLYEFGMNYNGQPGSYRVQPGNPDLKWEQTAKFNIGTDISLWAHRLNIEFDYYHHTTKDMVFHVPLSRSTGQISIPRNVGKLENKGIEFSVGVTPVRTDKVEWDLTFIGSANKNCIKKLSTNQPIERTLTIVEPGRDIYTFKMKEWAGVDPDTGAPTWWKVTTDEKGKEISREKTFNYTEATKQYVGQASPKFQGSVSSKLELYGFDFSFQMNYSLGGKIYGDHLRYDEQTGASGLTNTTRYVYENRWQKPGDNALVPKFTYGNRSNANSASSRFLMKGDYLKLRNITLGYTLPKNFVNRIRLSNARVYVSADNIYTFVAKDYRGFDPSGIDPNGMQWWNYPPSRNVVFGLNLSF
ncbi:MAG: SusC/RagA family TonB-linked outer membrane protein [Odoribacter splanchnicus]